MNIDILIKQLITHEGLKLKPYLCTSGRLTIGIGRNLDCKGITEPEALILCQFDIFECYADLARLFSKWDSFGDDRQHALLDMRFNLGYSGFRGFKKMIAEIESGDWAGAAFEAMDSKWSGQIGEARRVFILDALLDGEKAYR